MTMSRPLYACVVVCVFALTTSLSALANAPEELGITLLPSASRIEPHRYNAGRDWEATTKFFREKFRSAKNVRTGREVSLPNVKYIHYANSNEASAWQGINVYQLKNGQVRIYVLPRAAAAATKG
jgi:hypothetical protein